MGSEYIGIHKLTTYYQLTLRRNRSIGGGGT